MRLILLAGEERNHPERWLTTMGANG